MFKFKVWLCKAIGDVHSAADESVKLRFYKQTKKNTYPNKTITQIIICLIGIILRDVLLREYLHFAITINFKMQLNYNFFYLLHYFSCELLPRPNLCYFYTYEISVSSFKFPFNLFCPLFLNQFTNEAI